MWSLTFIFYFFATITLRCLPVCRGADWQEVQLERLQQRWDVWHRHASLQRRTERLQNSALAGAVHKVKCCAWRLFCGWWRRSVVQIYEQRAVFAAGSTIQRLLCSDQGTRKSWRNNSVKRLECKFLVTDLELRFLHTNRLTSHKPFFFQEEKYFGISTRAHLWNFKPARRIW